MKAACHGLRVASPLALVLFVGIRVLHIPHDLPYYSIDENDIVEPALAFLSGDIDPRWYKYGPLYSYLLSLLYGALQLLGLLQQNWDDFFYAAFYDAGEFYLYARIVHSLLVLLICAVAVRFAQQHYSKNTAWIVFIIAAAPLLEIMTGFTARVDTLQALWVMLILLFISGFAHPQHSRRNYILAGICLGLSVATKPLPGLFVVPVILYAHLSSRKTSAVSHGSLAVLIVVALATHFCVNPYSLIHLDSYLLQQWQIITTQSEQNGNIPGWNLSWLADMYGWPFAVALFAAIAAAVTAKDPPTRILLIYIATSCGAYSTSLARTYWYAPVLPACLVLMARLLALLLANENIAKKSALQTALLLAAVTLLLWQPVSKLVTNESLPRADMAAERWVEKHIPSGARILTVGWYAASLPRITAGSLQQQGMWGEHFMYRRGENQHWVDAFKKSHQRYLQSNAPAFDIFNLRTDYGIEAGIKSSIIGKALLSEIYQHQLDKMAVNMKRSFIITASLERFSGSWEQNDNVRLLAKFTDRSNEIKIFQVGPPG